jgi:hypothetical protein
VPALFCLICAGLPDLRQLLRRRCNGPRQSGAVAAACADVVLLCCCAGQLDLDGSPTAIGINKIENRWLTSAVP